MAIISKPSTIVKGTAAEFTLFKGDLVNNYVVSSDVHFSDFTNWMSVNLNYKSTEGNQRKVVTFNSFEDFAPAMFFASEKARDVFQIESITIIDFDGDMLIVPRDALNTLQFDIDMSTNSESDEFLFLMEDGFSLLLESGDNLSL